MLNGLRRPGTGDNLTTREQRTLGRYKHLGLMRYKDLDAFYCTGCNMVINVKCVSCGVWSDNRNHLADYETVFLVEQPLTVSKADGLYWTPVTCRKCDYQFRVIVR